MWNKIGLIPKSRLYVHLSKDYETAKTVGSRHGNPVVYQINAKQMAEDGYPFYLSVNGVWLTKEGKGQTTRLSLNPFLVHT